MPHHHELGGAACTARMITRIRGPRDGMRLAGLYMIRPRLHLDQDCEVACRPLDIVSLLHRGAAQAFEGILLPNVGPLRHANATSHRNAVYLLQAAIIALHIFQRGSQSLCWVLCPVFHHRETSTER